MTEVVYREADLEEILPLRYGVLCTGRPWMEARFTGDDDENTHHFGAFSATPRGSANLGCVTYMLNSHDDEPAWQLRGMAIRPDLARTGIGKGLVLAAQAQLLAMRPCRLFWCRARVPAIPFYEKLGWQVVTDVYNIEHYGPHRNMMMRL